MTSPALPPESDAPFLDQVLEPLLEDFAASFERGFQLLENCPEAVLPLARQLTLMGRLETARRELAAARALRAAAPVPMALEMATITPWHELVVEVWSLSAALRAA
jgi:predicted ATPase